MRYKVLFPSIAAFVASGQVAVAQPTRLVVTAPRLIATTSFTPYQAQGTLGNATIPLSLQGVDYDWKTLADGGMNLSTHAGPGTSNGQMNAQSVPNGTYSVQFAFSQVWFATTFTVSRLSSGLPGTVVRSCSLTPSTATQSCDTGMLSVTDGHLNLWLAIVDAMGSNSSPNARLAKITVNLWSK
jgi:hypothetical protein